ncbi:MAG: APC family permease [Chloroflexi bacterium]|nr:APC family permease [Chloroflexota bacterium]
MAPLRQWLLEGAQRRVEGPYQLERHARNQQQPWYKVMCLTGVDYFSTLGYQPGIAALAAGALSPLATLILVVVTLCGALPMYRRVAVHSPHGEGSIAMLERLLSWWKGKLFVLCLLGFVATDFIITITLSAADATAHVLENPLVPDALSGERVAVTLVLIALLGAVFLKGFREAIGVAVVLVGTYLLLNAVVVVTAILHVAQQPAVVGEWQYLLVGEYGNPIKMIAVSMLLFPRLALGLSGFETGVAVMPLVQGEPGDTEAVPRGRIHNTHRLLATAAITMSVYLIVSSFVTTLLIPPEAFLPGGAANGRALAYLAHAYLGEGFGTLYDISTILILWFAGASAMAGLLNIVPRYLPRYGMAPEWARATRPLVLVFTAIALGVTLQFRADVDSQGGAYATGVLVLMTSASLAVTLAARRKRAAGLTLAFAAITFIFVYTTVVNIIERPDGVKIALCFIASIIVVSMISRAYRVTELRVSKVVLDPVARAYIDDVSRGTIRIIAHDAFERDEVEYADKEREERASNNIPPGDPVLFFEVTIRDPSEFAAGLKVKGEQIGRFRVLRADSATIPNALAALLLHIRDISGQNPHAYLTWSEAGPIASTVRYLLFGHGETAAIVHEVLREAEHDPERRPVIHVA